MRVLFTCLISASLFAQPQAVEIISSGAGLDDPVAITHAGDDRLFITEQPGRIRIYNGALLGTPFLDITGIVNDSGNEQGLLSVAFHPDYASNGFFFVNYTRGDGATVIARYEVSAGNPDVADSGSAAILLVIPQFASNHNGGQVAFGPDGYLYIGMGDGGGGNDPGCHGQNATTLLGSMLRIDVDQNVSSAPFHGIPASNPFVGHPSNREEIWAIGLRNPWRFSFDRETGDMYIGDVGQFTWEEITFEAAGDPGGRNYGWPSNEGTNCNPNAPSCSPPDPPCNDPSFTDPIIEYQSVGGPCSITGGYVAYGCDALSINGKYIYGDYCSQEVWSATEISPGNWQIDSLFFAPGRISTFGQDNRGEVYISNHDTGAIYQIVDPSPAFEEILPIWATEAACFDPYVTILDLIPLLPVP